jgi:hypothetical protein
MTRQQNDLREGSSTEYSKWLRNEPQLDSSKGFVTTNLDYIWSNYKTGRWMLIEEKRYKSTMTYAQIQQFKKLHAVAKQDDRYYGFHLIQFENTSPEDGKMWLDGKEITKEEHIKFLEFKADVEFYKSNPLIEK